MQRIIEILKNEIKNSWQLLTVALKLF
jgi:hypothetical protein